MRAEKQSIATEIKNRLSGVPYVILTDFTGLTVDGFSVLRSRLAKASARAVVVKNSLMKHTLKGLDLPDLSTALQGPTAVVYGDKDMAAAASICKSFTKEFKKLKIKGAILDKNVLTSAEVEAIADLPPRPVLQAQLLGLLNSPAAKLVRLLNTPAEQFVQIVKVKSEQGEKVAA